ncbi:hypothetical protein AVEN_202397-1 [Araneus ventricosus]|uniref:Uncharacterized protein n=1 Tax=Araneus ventricosus TaxID=182803 RepID=A0A4Y2IY55_ARAVE|nr:hypothetical protein AVEN_202397-1 [Araneus ventricosus]
MRVLKVLADAKHQDFPKLAKIISRDMHMDDILSDIIGPVIAKAKIFMQSLWLQELDWNDSLPTNILQVWNDFLITLPAVDEINVPRYILSDDVNKINLNGFSDASECAYGAVIYIRCVTNSGLIQTKLL